jgi:hypothetical protein
MEEEYLDFEAPLHQSGMDDQQAEGGESHASLANVLMMS